MDIKIRLLQLGMKQVDLIEPLRERGITISRSEMNLAINGRGTQRQHIRALEAINEILTEKEAEKDVSCETKG